MPLPTSAQHRRETANFKGNKDQQGKTKLAKAPYNTIQGSGQGSSFGYASKGNVKKVKQQPEPSMNPIQSEQNILASGLESQSHNQPDLDALDKDIANAQRMIRDFPVVQSEAQLNKHTFPSFSNPKDEEQLLNFEAQKNASAPMSPPEMFDARQSSAASGHHTAGFREGVKSKSSKSPAIRSTYSSKKTPNFS